jgi:hypothetical protein
MSFREVVGVLATIERFMMEADEKANLFLNGFLSKQHTRLKGVFDRHIVRIYCSTFSLRLTRQPLE